MNFGKTTSIIISGSAFLYLIAQSTKFLSSRIKVDRKILPSDDVPLNSHCCICDTEKVEGSSEKFVKCKACGAFVCPRKCSEFTSESDQWECFRCRKNRLIQQKTGEWFLKQLNDFSKFNFEMALGENILNLQSKSANEENGNKNKKIVISKVREIIEKSLVKILDGNESLDGTPIEKISDSEEYLHIFKKYHHVLTSLIFKLEKSIHISLACDLPNSDCINTDYAELKRFVNRICHEVINISDTIEFTESTVPKAAFAPQTYEELLATAVLNKITTDYLHRKKYGISSQMEAERDSEVGADDEENDFSFYDKMHLDKIQSHKISLPDLLNEFDSLNEDDEFSNGNHSGSWEDNWSLKQLSQDQKISMLIPLPAYEVKTKIGEKDIDEISDYSDKNTNSDNFDELFEEDNDHEDNFTHTESIQNEEQLFSDILQSTVLKEHNNNKVDNESFTKINDTDVELESEALFNNISNFSASKENIDEIFEQILRTENNVGSDGKSKNQVTDKKPFNEQKSIQNDNDEEIQSSSQIIPKAVDANEKDTNENNCDTGFSTNEGQNSQKYKSPLLTQYLVKPIQPIKISDALKNAQNNSDEVKEILSEKSNIVVEEILPEKSDIVVEEIVSEKSDFTIEVNFPQKSESIKKEESSIPKSPLLIKQIDDSFRKAKIENDVNSPPIPGSIAEREHLKWLKAIPIENNPYSPEALHKRLSRSQDKHIDINTEKVVDNDESNNFDDVQLREDITKYKRDYYVNSLSHESLTNTSKQFTENEDVETRFVAEQPYDSILTASDDSITRVYTLSSQETTIILPSHESAPSFNEKEQSDNEERRMSKIEEDIPLPSVRKLAEFYASSNNVTESNTKQAEPMNIPIGISKSTLKVYEISEDLPAKPIASITARTLPPKIKEDLRKSLQPDVRHGQRNSSPDIQQGLAKNSIAYFENFYK